MESASASVTTLASYLVVMGMVSILEAALPLKTRVHWNRAHLLPNLSLSLIALGCYTVLNGALIIGLVALESRGAGLLLRFDIPAPVSVIASLLALDLVTYVAHVAMHRCPVLWRFHRIHHTDPAVDVTTTLRQHPGESLIRVAFLAGCAIPLGVSPAAFAIYRSASALCAFLEHANIRVPARIDDALALVFTWPNLHKIHHSREAGWTDTNYGNLFSWWDRLCGTFTPADLAAEVTYGLQGFDDPAAQTTAALLRAPFNHEAEARREDITTRFP